VDAVRWEIDLNGFQDAVLGVLSEFLLLRLIDWKIEEWGRRLS
jgi:hypothetical protein